MLRARFLATSLLLWLSPGVFSWACQICIPFPTDSLADHLLKSSTVVLARENPDAPFTLQTTTILAGDSSPPPLELFLDSQSRRILSGSPEKSAICGYQPDGDPAGWRRIGLDHGELRPLVEEILRRAPEWDGQPDDRPRFFAPYLRHSDPQIATLAHLEVARAPYSQIRDLAGAIPIAEIRNYLSNIRYAEWHALYILFLAQSEDPVDRQRIVKAFESNAEYSITLQTAAWATAYIEIKQLAGLDDLDRLYLANPRRSPEEMEAIQAACSVQGSNTPGELQERIVESYRKALEHHPRLAPRIVADLEKWQRPELRDSIVKILSGGAVPFIPEETLQLRAYVRSAGSPTVEEAERPSRMSPYLWLIAGLLLLPYVLRWVRARAA